MFILASGGKQFFSEVPSLSGPQNSLATAHILGVGLNPLQEHSAHTFTMPHASSTAQPAALSKARNGSVLLFKGIFVFPT